MELPVISSQGERILADSELEKEFPFSEHCMVPW